MSVGSSNEYNGAVACKALAGDLICLWHYPLLKDLGDLQGVGPTHTSQRSQAGGMQTLMLSCVAGADNGHSAVAEHASGLDDTGDADMHIEDPALADAHVAALTLHGMVRRVARLAGETSWTRCAIHAVPWMDSDT